MLVRMKTAMTLVVAVLMAAAVAVAPATPAAADILPSTVTVTLPHGANYSITITWGFHYNTANNHLRAYARMAASSSATHVHAQPLNLGDRNGVLASTDVYSPNGLLDIETGAVSCHYPNGVYRSNLHYAIRWPDDD